MAQQKIPATAHEVREAATVVCVREGRQAQRGPRELRGEDYDLVQSSDPLPKSFRWPFTSNLQVLMGQNEVVNWLRSSKETTKVMRYPGEFKFAGGTKDDGESLLQTARRELIEEFPIAVPEEAKFRFLKKYKTRPVQGRSYVMNNFVALSSENPWIDQIDTQACNRALEDRKEQFQKLLESGEFWSMHAEEKEKVSPEVSSIQWLYLDEAVHYCLTSKSKELRCVNEFQAEGFKTHGIHKRDPMFATMMLLNDLEKLGSLDQILAATTTLSPSL